MARTPAALDAFAAIAEPRRREVLNVLARSSDRRDVSWIVDELGWPQPQVSKHLAVLREVGLVSVVRQGRQRMYSLNGRELRLVHDWVKTFERYWDEQLNRIKDRAERMAREARPPRKTLDKNEH